MHILRNAILALVCLFASGCCIGTDCGGFSCETQDSELQLNNFSAAPTSPGMVVFPGSTIRARFTASVAGDWCANPYTGSGWIDYTLMLDGIEVATGQHYLNNPDPEAIIEFAVPATWASPTHFEYNDSWRDLESIITLQISDHATTITTKDEIHGLITVDDFYSSSMTDTFAQVITSVGLETPACIAISSPADFRYSTDGKTDSIAGFLGDMAACTWDFDLTTVTGCEVNVTFPAAGTYPVAITLRYPPVEVTGTVNVTVVPECPD